MNELIKVDCSGEQMKVSGRELHKFLEVDTPYSKWFQRVCTRIITDGNGGKATITVFFEGIDYQTLDGQKCPTNNPKNPWATVTDHKLNIDMVKEICMMSRTDKGEVARKYFIQVEKDWNSPEKVMARALKFADQTINQLNQTIAIMEPKARYYDIVLACKDLVPTTIISKDYGWSATKLNRWLNENGYQYRRGNTWVLYEKYADKGYTSSKTHVYEDKSGREHSSMQTQWTQAGRLFVYNELKKRGILPMIEQDTMQERM